jgi:hypothetical protein
VQEDAKPVATEVGWRHRHHRWHRHHRHHHHGHRR